MVSTARSAEQVAHDAPLMLRGGSTAGVLVHGIHFGAGIRAEIDLAVPDRWRAVTVPPAFARHPAVAGATEPWLRVGVVDALDRWLALPLDQALVDAERGVVRGRAARTLPAECVVRQELTGDGLRLARRASAGVAAFLRQLGWRSVPPPPRLAVALQDLVAGYSELLGELSGPDRALSSVVNGWQRLIGRGGSAVRPVGRLRSDPREAAPAQPLGRSLLDPRQIRARVLALSADPGEPEVDLVAAASGDPDVVEVRVRAARPGRPTTPRLLVRLVDRRSGQASGHAVLRPVDPATWTATVPLCGLTLAQVRADVADVLSELPPAPDDSDPDLLDARRAAVFLAEWRQLVGLVQCSVAAAPARHLRGLAARLHAPRARHDAALFSGGPSYAELNRLADLRDDELSRRLCDDGSAGASLRILTTSGAAGLMVAEVAALLLGPQL